MAIKIICIFIMASTLIKVSETSDLIKKTVSIANSAFQKYHLTSVVWMSCDNNIVTDFLKRYEGTVVTVAINKAFDLNNTEFHAFVLYKQTVFFASDPAEFEYFLKVINRVIIYPIQVIMVFVNHKLLSTYVSTEFTKTAWENDVGDIVVVGYETNETIALKTYFPYENGGCGNYTPVHLKGNTTNFFKAKFRNFNGCPIRSSLLDFIPYVALKKENDTVTAVGGLDGNLLKLIIETLNSTMDIVLSENHGVVSSCINGTRVGSFNDLVYNKADIMIPSIIIVSKRYTRSQISHVYYTVKVVWCMPNRREIYDWVKAILPFLNVTTPIIILAILIIMIILRLVKKFGKSKKKSNIGLFEMIGIFLGQQVTINSKYRMVNRVLVFWVWFSLVVRISYQGQLIDGLRKTILEPPINTLAEALEVVDEVGGMPTFIELYRNTSIEHKYNELKLRDIPNYLKEMAAGRKFLLAIDVNQLKYYHEKLQILEERVTSMPSCIHMRARWPAGPQVSRLISRMVQSGLLIKIWRDMRNEWLLKNRKILAKETVSVEPLDLDILSSCFYGLFVMYCISFFVFCLEIILDRYKRGKRRL